MAQPIAAMLTICAAATFVIGCATSKLYDGPTRPPSELSILSLEKDRASLSFIEVDRRETGGRAVEMLPGKHKVRVMLKYMKHFDSGFIGTSFKVLIRCVAIHEFAAGRRYVLRPVVNQVEAIGLQESVTFSIVLEDEAARDTPLGETRCYH